MPDVAHLGLVRPPLVFLTSLIAGALIQFVRPFPFLPATLAMSLGASLVVLAIALFSYAVGKFRAAATPVPARKPTTAIVRTGPYRLSRNPIYLGPEFMRLDTRVAPPTACMSPPAASFRRRTSSMSRTILVFFQETVWSVRDTTTCGVLPANSAYVISPSVAGLPVNGSVRRGLSSSFLELSPCLIEAKMSFRDALDLNANIRIVRHEDAVDRQRP